MTLFTPETYDRFSRWVFVAEVLAVSAVAWALVTPVRGFWTAVLATALFGLTGLTVAMVLVVRNRAVPSLAQVITAERER